MGKRGRFATRLLVEGSVVMFGSPPFVSAMKFGHEWKRSHDTSWTKTFAGKILEFPRDLGDVAELHDLPPQRPTTPYRGGRWGESHGHVAESTSSLPCFDVTHEPAASGTAGGARDWWSSALRTSFRSKCSQFCLKMWDEKSTAAVAHTMPKDLQDSSHQEEYYSFWAWEFQPKPLFVPVSGWGTARSDKLVPNLFCFTKQLAHPRKRTNDQVAGNPKKNGW